MTEERKIQAMAKRIADLPDDDALAQVDQAIDNIVAGLITLQENLPSVEAEGVPQQAAKDEVTSILDEAVLPYMADVVKLMSAFDDD